MSINIYDRDLNMLSHNKSNFPKGGCPNPSSRLSSCYATFRLSFLVKFFFLHLHHLDHCLFQFGAHGAGIVGSLRISLNLAMIWP